MSVSFGGFNANTATFKTNTELESGCAVKISESNTVEACAGGKDGYASVQLSGAVTAAYTGAAPEVGYSSLASDGAGVKASGDGREYLVIAVDESAMTVTFLM